MNISVENLTSVDKKITIEADKADLAPKIDQALRKYRKTMNLPGFRPGTAPLQLIKKRIGKEVEGEQIEQFVQDVFQKEIVPEHKPIGEPKMEKMDYTDGNLNVEILIGTKPEFELSDISELSVDKLVHDVTDEEVQKEFDHTIKRQHEKTETDEAAKKDSKIKIDVVTLDADGNETDDKDDDVELDLADEGNEEYADALKGKKAGDTADIVIEEDGNKTTYRATVKAVYELKAPEQNEEFFKKISRDQASNEEEFRSFLKSQIQNYFDQTAEDLFRDRIATSLIEAHDFEVPKTIHDEIVNARLSRIMQENDNKLPEDFDRDAFLKENEKSIADEGKWTFIIDKLMEKYPDTEIEKEDVDQFFEVEAARMGLPAEMLRNFYASQTEQLEQLRMRIRTDKLFSKLADEVKTNELSKDAYEKKHNKNDK